MTEGGASAGQTAPGGSSGAPTGQGPVPEEDAAVIDLATLSREELEALQAEVAAAIATLERQRKAQALAELVRRARELGFTLRELTGTSELAPWELRYANPANANQTWCGRGRKPRWFEKAMAAGRTPEDMLI